MSPVRTPSTNTVAYGSESSVNVPLPAIATAFAPRERTLEPFRKSEPEPEPDADADADSDPDPDPEPEPEPDSGSDADPDSDSDSDPDTAARVGSVPFVAGRVAMITTP
ncbi:MAG: hypothetical protein ABI678_13290, partial [Kofleriaceae bacterium]